MEPTSSPDNNRSPRGLSRFWPVHRDAGDPADTAEHPEISVALPGEPQMVALGSRRTEFELGRDPFAPPAANAPVHGNPIPLAPGQHGGIVPVAPFASARPPAGGPSSGGPSADGPSAGGPSADGSKPVSGSSGRSGNGSGSVSGMSGNGNSGGMIGGALGGSLPAGGNPSASTGGNAAKDEPGPETDDRQATAPAGQHEAREGDPDHSGASDTGEDAAQDVESRRANPWDRDTGSFGGFGLTGRNGRFLFGGRTIDGESHRGLNGHSGHELNGRARRGVDEPSTVDGPAPGEPADDTVAAQASDENGRDEMNGRAGVPGFPAPGESVPAEQGQDGRRADAAEQPAPEGRRQATGWASVPTSTHPVVTPTSGAPVSSSPVSPGFATPAYGQPPSYVPALPDPASGPVSGVPAPRGAASAPAPAAPADQQPSPAGADNARPTVTPPTAMPPANSGQANSGLANSGLANSGLANSGLTTSGPTNSGLTSGLTSRPTSGPTISGAVAPVTPAAEPGEPQDSPKASVAETLAALRTADEAHRQWEDDNGLRPPAPRRSATLEDVEPARRGRRAAPDPDDEPALGEDHPMRPGDIEAGHIAFWDDDATRHFRAAWHEVKAEFVDDPVTALTRAHDLLTDAVNELTEALLAERDELDPLRGNTTPDTESMRMAMRGYREFLDRILAL
jgi:hypothetical protein